MSKFVKITVWFILFMAGLSICLSMVSTAKPTEKVLGGIILGIIVAISVETKCLTTIKLKKHDEPESA